MEKIKALKGTYDILPEDSYKWDYIEKTAKEVCRDFGFDEIRFPVFEYTDLFARGVGDTTDVVQKEMYTFTDKGGRSITLRPEGTAGTVRSVLEHSLLAGALPIKLFYLITCYRNEKPQAGRYREFRQFGIEAFGSSDFRTDAEIISLAMEFFSRLGLKGLSLNINSIGCPECRAKYNKALKEFLAQKYDSLCPTCKTRFDKNPMRILDCKDPSCGELVADAPVLLDYICEECEGHFAGVKHTLDLLGIEYNIDSGIVRGLDYYTKTVFEIKSGSLGAQSTVCGGGRYDGLVEQLGGHPTPGIGFGLGLERLLLTMEAQGIEIPGKPTPKIFVCELGDKAVDYGVKLVADLRKKGISAVRDCMGRGLKAQMKYADKIGAEYTIVIGDNEIEAGKCALKHMESGESQEIILSEIDEYLRKG